MSEFLDGFETMGNMIENTGERHIACVLLVDISGSMAGASIQELNQGLREFGNALEQDEHARGVADVCVISFNSSVETVVPFCPASSYSAPTLSARGLTSMNEAIIAGLNAIEERKQLYRQLGCSYYRPWMFLLTDGEPTDPGMEAEAKNQLHQALSNKKVVFFPMGIGSGANYAHLKSYTMDREGNIGKGPVLKAKADNFKEAFVWLSSSMSVVSNSDPSLGSVSMGPTPITVDLI